MKFDTFQILGHNLVKRRVFMSPLWSSSNLGPSNGYDPSLYQKERKRENLRYQQCYFNPISCFRWGNKNEEIERMMKKWRTEVLLQNGEKNLMKRLTRWLPDHLPVYLNLYILCCKQLSLIASEWNKMVWKVIWNFFLRTRKSKVRERREKFL